MNELIGVKFLLRHGHFLVFQVRREDAQLWVQQHASCGFKARGVQTICGKCYLSGADFSLDVAELVAIHTVQIQVAPAPQQSQFSPGSGQPSIN